MNPLYNTNDSPNNATQPTKAVNREGVFVPRTHNRFDVSYFNYTTQQFGKYCPFYVAEGVPGDTIPLRSPHEIRSYPMRSPFLSTLKLNKDYFMVPMQAILPNTWELIYKTPSQGDDVPSDAMCNVGFLFDSNTNPVLSRLLAFLQAFGGQAFTTKKSKAFLSALFIAESLFSTGSLLYRLGYKLNPYAIDPNTGINTFDDMFDAFWNTITQVRVTIMGDDGITRNYSYGVSGETDAYPYYTQLTKQAMVSFLREHLHEVASLDNSLELASNNGNKYVWRNDVQWKNIPVNSTASEYVNISRILGYQLSCQQFYVNPQVDFLYNAELYRNNFYSILQDLFDEYNSTEGSTIVPLGARLFDYNGFSIPYDFFSQTYFDSLQKVIVGATVATGTSAETMYYVLQKLYGVFHYLFGLRESLKFGDYFTDCRTRALGVVNDSELSAPVVGEKVAAVDMSKSIVMQRFANAVVKLNNTFGDYLRGIMGTSPSPDYHIPKFISHAEFSVGNFEVANTSAEGQGELVTNLKSSADNMAFEITVDMPCVIFGISYFSLPRVYTQTKERFFFHLDRFDMFNPMLQFIGDQAVDNKERTDQALTGSIRYGYQSRNAEYKQRYSQASGGFVNKLPGWTFLADALFSSDRCLDMLPTQSPDNIRAHDYEFDRFFSSSGGFSLGNKFHFIMVYNNQSVANRPMIVNPNIL